MDVIPELDTLWRVFIAKRKSKNGLKEHHIEQAFATRATLIDAIQHFTPRGEDQVHAFYLNGLHVLMELAHIIHAGFSVTALREVYVLRNCLVNRLIRHAKLSEAFQWEAGRATSMHPGCVSFRFIYSHGEGGVEIRKVLTVHFDDLNAYTKSRLHRRFGNPALLTVLQYDAGETEDV